MKIKFLLVLLLASELITRGILAQEQGILSLYATIPPQAFFVREIGGKFVRVKVLLRPGKSPATYTASSRELSGLGRAVILFCLGVPFEKSLLPGVRANFSRLKIVNTARGIKLRAMQTHTHNFSAVGNERDKQVQRTLRDPHTWLSPVLAKQHCQVILQALEHADEKHAALYQQNTKILLAKIELLHQKIKKMMLPFKGRKLFVFHPAFGYFADAYGLQQIAVELEGKSPKGRELLKFIKYAKQQQVRVLFVQPEFYSRRAGAIARAINSKLVKLDPMAVNWLDNLEVIAKCIVTALGK